MSTIDDIKGTFNLRTKQWQLYLQTNALYHGPVDGKFGDQTKEATRQFQRANGLSVTGVYDEPTKQKAREVAHHPFPAISPAGDGVRDRRPYFIVPIDDDPNNDDAKSAARSGILTALKDGAITDVFIVSHGWHRNYAVALAAYDRVVSRFYALFRRGRIVPTGTFKPLFVGLHWHSDPGSDNFVDPSGRRDKDSFLRNVREHFEPRVGAGQSPQAAAAVFIGAFEDLYELFMFLTAPGADNMPAEMAAKQQTLLTTLPTICQFRESTIPALPTDVPEMMCLAWRCYHEATPKRELMDQGERSRRYMSPSTAAATLVKFGLSVAGLAALLGPLQRYSSTFYKFLVKENAAFVRSVDGSGFEKAFDNSLAIALSHLKIANALHLSHPHLSSSLFIRYVAGCGLGLFTLFLGGLIVLSLTALWQYHMRRNHASQGLPLLATVSWFAMQVFCVLPLVLYGFCTYLFRTAAPLLILFWPYIAWQHTLAWFAFWILFGTLYSQWAAPSFGIFDERAKPMRLAFLSMRGPLASLAQFPTSMLRRAVAPDSRVLEWAATLDNQLAFFLMQQEGAGAGERAGKFFVDLFNDPAAPPIASRPRIHVMGHSFGALVVTNLVDYIGKCCPDGLSRISLDSAVLLQGAIASSWFERTDGLVDGAQPVIKGKLACIYSAYDTANGFLYSLANNGRMAAGAVGLTFCGNKNAAPREVGKGGLFASLVTPPTLNQYVGVPPPTILLNLDCSRIIYDGPAATGGGHDDIFKDDVIHVIWAACALGSF